MSRDSEEYLHKKDVIENPPLATWGSNVCIRLHTITWLQSIVPLSMLNSENWDLNLPIKVWTPIQMIYLLNSQYNLRSRNLGMPAEDNRDTGGLELHINWRKMALPDTWQGIFCMHVVKPEPYANSSQKEIETYRCSSLKLVGIRRMKSETCNGSFKGEASRVADPFDQKLLSGKLVKSEPPKEFKRKSPVMALDYHQLMSPLAWSCPQVKLKPVVLDFNAAHDVNMLCDDSPVMAGNATIGSGESTQGALAPATVSVPSISCKAEDVISDIRREYW